MNMPKKHALVVDDSEGVRVTLQGMLAQYDLTVDMAVSAEDALDYLSHTRPDVIFIALVFDWLDPRAAGETDAFLPHGYVLSLPQWRGRVEENLHY
jgi:CheY-like chemotaxis protein